jgi:NEDD8-activating enzyme E1
MVTWIMSGPSLTVGLKVGRANEFQEGSHLKIGFRGQARVILPTITSCYECSLDMLNKPTAFPICTIANTPRLPEHCIEWASVLEWPRVHGSKKMDTDDPDHIGWLYRVASARAREFNIEGVTWSLTQGVVKNIIPAIASTNAIIAGEHVDAKRRHMLN